eukprot:g1411.t1
MRNAGACVLTGGADNEAAAAAAAEISAYTRAFQPGAAVGTLTTFKASRGELVGRSVRVFDGSGAGGGKGRAGTVQGLRHRLGAPTRFRILFGGEASAEIVLLPAAQAGWRPGPRVPPAGWRGGG